VNPGLIFHEQDGIHSRWVGADARPDNIVSKPDSEAYNSFREEVNP